MEGTTSTSNEGSKRDLNNRKEMKVKKVSDKEIQKRMVATYSKFDFNCVAWNVEVNLKAVQDSNPVNVSSSNSLEYNEELFLNPDYCITWTNVNLITPEKEEKISKRRKKEEEKKKAAKEAAEAKEAADAKKAAEAQKENDNKNR